MHTQSPHTHTRAYTHTHTCTHNTHTFLSLDKLDFIRDVVAYMSVVVLVVAVGFDGTVSASPMLQTAIDLVCTVLCGCGVLLI